MYEIKKKKTFGSAVLSLFFVKLKRNKISTFGFGVKGTKDIYHRQFNISLLRPKLLFPSSAEIHKQFDKY